MVELNPENPILLVDDEESLLTSLKFSLKSSGFNNIETCSDSTQVMNLLSSKDFSLIVLDNMMPNLSGRDLLPKIKENHHHVPVIMLTAVHEPEVIVESMKNGAFDYLVKPVNKSLFVTQIERALQFSTIHKENVNLNSSLQEAVEELRIKAQTQEDLLSKLKKSTYQLRSILKALPAVIILVDGKGNIAQCNDKVSDYFGIGYSDVVYKPFEDFIKKIGTVFEDKDRFNYVISQLQRQLSQDGHDISYYTVELENRLALSTEGNRVLSVVSAPINPSNTAEMGAIWVFRDISDVVRSEEQLQTIINASPVPLLISKLEDGKFLYANQHLANLIGVTQEEVLKKKTVDFYYDPKERETIVAELMKEKKVVNHELKIRTADGEFIWAVINLVFSHLNGQDVIVGGISDISDQKNTIETLEATKKELLDTQSRLVQSEKMASLGNLVAGIAHEINNPVGAVSSSADAAGRALNKMEEKVFSESCDSDIKNDGKLKKIFDIIKDCHKIILEGSSRISSIVRSLKNFSRIDEAEYLTADIHEGLESTLALVNHQFKNRITVEKKYGNLPEINCYPNQLNQVFMNMMVNAGQAIADKGTVTIETKIENNHAQIIISDTGKGIKKENLSKVFDPGYTTKGVGVGTGLGLSISYNIIEKHGGTIEVDSEEGKGTSFCINIPIK